MANFYFLPHPPSQPPSQPPDAPCGLAAVPGVLIFFSKLGNSTCSRAKSKNKGLQGIGSKLGGNGYKLGFPVTKLGSS